MTSQTPLIQAAAAPTFPGLIDLASATLGGRTLACSDEFFAAASNLCSPKPAVFDPDRYTDRGKWMDGWESRRRRTPGEDWCLIQLGVRGLVHALNLDTSHFLGNHAPFARVEACDAPGVDSAEALADADWAPLLDQRPLQAGSHNLFTVAPRVATHLRLTITPDGGVARLRAHGVVTPEPEHWGPWEDLVDEVARAHLEPGERDLAALRHGGRALACSDMFFAPMNNLIAPGRSTYMGGGWETRRKRGPGHDWILLELAVPGRLGAIEIDTGHFHGNHAQRCALWGIHAPGARITDLLAKARTRGGWHEVLPESPLSESWEPILSDFTLGPDRRVFTRALASNACFTHVRLETFPDGGVARLRLFGRAEDQA